MVCGGPHELGQPDTTETSPLTLPEARSPKSGCEQGSAPPGGPREDAPSLQLLVEAAFRGSQLIAPIHASVFLWLFPSASAFPLFSEDSILLDLGPISFLFVTPP